MIVRGYCPEVTFIKDLFDKFPVANCLSCCERCRGDSWGDRKRERRKIVLDVMGRYGGFGGQNKNEEHGVLSLRT